MTLTAVNPATGETIRDYEENSWSEAEAAIRAAHEAHEAWRHTDFEQRARLMYRAAELLRDRVEHYAGLMAREMGKPLAEGRSEVEKCAWVCDYYAKEAEEQLAPIPVGTPDTDAETYIAYEPLGTILAIMPWNFPFWQVFRFAAPNLMAGNAGLLKHAANVPGCALAIEEIFRDAGFPQGLFRSLLIGHDVSDKVIEHPLVRAVTLTGSVRAGKTIAAKAGSLIKKTVLELGGSDAYLVLEDADLDATVETCVKSRLVNSGQSCIAAKRFVVVKSLKEAFERRMVERMKAARMGDPMDESVDLGPQAREDLRDELHRQVIDSIEAGARCLLGGEVPDGPGSFYPPTVLTDVKPGMPAYGEELFGPVASIIEVEDEADGIRVAN
ncbi:MAG: NAD-dependent succinate-semialdehyde dehydrogenase, partial [Gemmatimonadota bacterium]